MEDLEENYDEKYDNTYDFNHREDHYQLVSFVEDQTYQITVESEPNLVMRHSSFEFWLGPTTDSSDSNREDSLLTVRAGLNGSPDSISFESVNYPGYFLRH